MSCFVCFSLFLDAHGVQRKVWENIQTRSLSQYLTVFPNKPSISDYITTMEAPQRVAQTFGQTLTAYFLAPETGDHVFYIACDDVCQPWISRNTDPEHAQMIIDVRMYTPYRRWEG